MTGALKAALTRHQAISVAALIALVLLAWWAVLSGAGTGMVPQASLLPTASPPTTMDGMAMDGMTMEMAMDAPAATDRIPLLFAMWWIMMVAMMLPSAAPTILLYMRAGSGLAGRARAAPSRFLAGYLLAWGGFCAFAVLLQMALERGGVLDPLAMASHSRTLSGALLAAAGLYQLGPFKNACLRTCRDPARFLSRHYRPGGLGALRMGALHGAICVGCCWVLMALLFVGGVMNLAWIVLLTLAVAAEKLLLFGRVIAVVLGIACLGASATLLLG